MQNIWIIGCGDIGRRVASLYQNEAKQTSKPCTLRGIVRSESSRSLAMEQGIHASIIDLDHPLTHQTTIRPEDFEQALVFYFAPPPSTSVTDTRLQNVLSFIKNQANKWVLISTTGVYGDSHGEWIDENAPLNPVADRAKRRLSAEQTVIDWAKTYNKQYIILRVPGIYAKDRLPLARLQKKLPIVDEDEAPWTNRIHADDLAQICKTAMESTISNEIYNATDGHPSTMTAYFNQVADYANLPRPPQISMQEAEQTLSAGMLSYLKESRRISNKKLLQELNINLQYPDLVAGLAKK
jgi:nucleoside-diphosphate-sugar epimerase